MSKKQAIQELLDRKPLNTAIQKPVNTGIHNAVNTDIMSSTPIEPTQKKKKATFDLDLDLHTELKVFAAQQDKKMVEVVEAALRMYFESHKVQ